MFFRRPRGRLNALNALNTLNTLNALNALNALNKACKKRNAGSLASSIFRTAALYADLYGCQAARLEPRTSDWALVGLMFVSRRVRLFDLLGFHTNISITMV